MLNRNEIEKTLIEIGIFPNLKGFAYTTEMILLIDTGKPMTKTQMYEIIGRQYKVSASSVISGVRTALRHATYNKDTEVYKKYIGNSVTTTEKLFTIHNRLSRESEYNKFKEKARENMYEEDRQVLPE